MSSDHLFRRKLWSHIITVLAGLTVIAVLVPLASILYEAFSQGGSVLSLSFLVSNPPLPCSNISGVTCPVGGIGPALQGTIILVSIAAVISITIGIAAAVFVVEYPGRWLSRAISFTADVLTGLPSIIAGLVVYSYLVVYYPQIVFSAISGTLALSIIMIPIVTCTCEEALRTVPHSVREAALALGIPKWRTNLQIVLITALPGVLTGALLAVMRGAGEAAPLLFTAFGSSVGFQGFNQPIAALPLMIYTFATTGYSNWIALAWGAALVLILLLLVTSILSRLVIMRMTRRMKGE